jgi:LPS O-antigen subunit length determinant protein (WzzB/FepE family)
LWANTLAKYVNDRLRVQAEKRAERNVAYLKNEIASTSVVSLEQSIGSLLESEMQKLMLARSNQEFAFRVIDPGVVPISPDSPGPLIVLAASILAGGFVSILVLVVRRTVQVQPRR